MIKWLIFDLLIEINRYAVAGQAMEESLRATGGKKAFNPGL
jgi:hypothetical protein